MNPYPVLLLVAALLVTDCAQQQKINPNLSDYNLNQPLTRFAPYDEGYPLTDAPYDSAAPYKTEEYIQYWSDFYKEKKNPPPFHYDMNLSGKTFHELRLLRAEILARHGFLFMDYVLRSHFNATDWYRPVFWYNDFRIKLNTKEKQFIANVLKREKELYRKNYYEVKGLKKAAWQNVVNREQFNTLPEEMLDHLVKDGFVINKGQYEQLFHVYDENYYDYTPGFITSDLFLQTLHMHISKEMQSMEKQKMIPLLNALIQDMYTSAASMVTATQDPFIKRNAEWVMTYYAIALRLGTGKDQKVPGSFRKAFQNEVKQAEQGQGSGSSFLGDTLFDYTQFQPRGNYSRDDSLKLYFKLVKWLNSAPVYVDTDAGLSRALIMGDLLQKSTEASQLYKRFSAFVEFLAGKENNLSLVHVLQLLAPFDKDDVPDLFAKGNLVKLGPSLLALDPKKSVTRGANELTSYFLHRKKVMFTAARYTFDGEILQRMIYITREDLRQEPKRPFPKGLDVFAVMGDKTAEEILLNEYREADSWEDYPDTLNVLKQQFRGYNLWDQSIYNKTMELMLSLHPPLKQAPYFMLLPAWKRKDLNTMLSGWTELKHDMILYIDQPVAVEMGDGGEIPPPQKIAYVEPQVNFWKNCINLLTLNENALKQNGFLTDKIAKRNTELKDLAAFLLRISTMELNHQPLSNAQFDSLAYIGGKMEWLTLNILESTQMTTKAVETPERYIAIATDVYTYNDHCLEEAVGLGDEIYVIAEINGLLYLTRGAVFSHYEFTRQTDSRLTDEDWQKLVLDQKQPAQAPWLRDIVIHVKKPGTAPNFNLY